MQLTINGVTKAADTASAVVRELKATAHIRYREVWLSVDGGAALAALINGERGWLMFLREEGDAGFSSRNPEFQGPSDAMIKYELSNGQMDEHPAAWALDLSKLTEALTYFMQHGTKPPFVHWHDEST